MKWLYYRYIYARLMRFLHKHDWHKMERNPNIEPGKIHLWCHWCGVRSTINDPKYTTGILKAGSYMDDKGYQLGTEEGYNEFVRKRNESNKL